MARIYLDTNLWNISLDQRITPEVLLRRLDEEDSTIVLSLHAVDELSRTFWKKESQGRAQSLLSHLGEYMDAGLRCIAKEVPESLKAEMWALNGIAGSSKFLDSDDVFKVRDFVAQLARGEVVEGCLDGLSARRSQAIEERTNLIEHVHNNRSLAVELLRVGDSELPAWLDGQVKSNTGTRLLTEKLGSLFSEVPTVELFEYAQALIANSSRTATAMLRADCYSNWRCTRPGSNRRDLLDDLYHLLNAVYCDVYATEETKQMDYAHLILLSTRTAIYDRHAQPLDEWLIGIAKRART